MAVEKSIKGHYFTSTSEPIWCNQAITPLGEKAKNTLFSKPKNITGSAFKHNKRLTFFNEPHCSPKHAELRAFNVDLDQVRPVEQVIHPFHYDCDTTDASLLFGKRTVATLAEIDEKLSFACLVGQRTAVNRHCRELAGQPRDLVRHCLKSDNPCVGAAMTHLSDH